MEAIDSTLEDLAVKIVKKVLTEYKHSIENGVHVLSSRLRTISITKDEVYFCTIFSDLKVTGDFSELVMLLDGLRREQNYVAIDIVIAKQKQWLLSWLK